MNGVRLISLSALLLTCFTVNAQEIPAEVVAGDVFSEISTEPTEPVVDPMVLEVQQMLDRAKQENDRRRNMRVANLTEAECLATAMYHEARGEGDAGMKAVAFVIYNRSKSGRWPSNICAVVTQPHQFSFVGDRNPDNIKQWNSYERALQLAVSLLNGGFATESSPARNATYFNSLAKPSNWTYAKARKFIITLGNHHFFN